MFIAFSLSTNMKEIKKMNKTGRIGLRDSCMWDNNPRYQTTGYFEESICFSVSTISRCYNSFTTNNTFKQARYVFQCIYIKLGCTLHIHNQCQETFLRYYFSLQPGVRVFVRNVVQRTLTNDNSSIIFLASTEYFASDQSVCQKDYEADKILSY